MRATEGLSGDTFRPAVWGNDGAVVAGHPAAAVVGLEVLRSGGNAIDAGVAMGLAMNVVVSHECSFFGVAPTMIHHAASGEVVNLDGTGVWPAAISVDLVADAIANPTGPPRRADALHAVTPGTPDAWITALARYGTRTFAESAAPAIALADDGFPMYAYLHSVLTAQPESYRRWPGSEPIYFPAGEVPPVGSRFRQRDLAATLRAVAAAEQGAGRDRDAGFRAARDAVYRGELARTYVDYCRSEGGVLTLDDMAEYAGRSETPAHVTYRGLDVYGSGLWGQGPVFPYALKLLEGYDLAALGHNSPETLHLVSQALDLAFADREVHMGDPRFTGVDLAALLDEEYLAARRELIDLARAWPEMPPAGDPGSRLHTLGPARTAADPPTAVASFGPRSTGTTYLAAADRDGNIFSCIASDGARSCPVVPGLGVVLSSRGFQCRLEEGHPAAPAPGKRPRLTPAPALVLRDGRAHMALGGYGGDMITQAILQVFLNATEFGLDPQAAVEAPRAYSRNFPSSHHRPTYEPGTMAVEGRIGDDVVSALESLGHTVRRLPAWWEAGACMYCMIRVDPKSGALQAGADPRGGAYALAY